MIRYTKDTDNIVTLTLDMENRSVNIINHEIGKAFIPVIEYLKMEKAKGVLRGIIIASAKKSFLAGGDLDYLYQALEPKEIFNFSQTLKKIFRDLEKPGVPVVAAINGAALGIGFELTLACHHRIALNEPKSELGLPEATLGLMPGSGGVIRLLWLLGLEKAYEILTSGKRFSPKEAYKVGIIDDLADDDDEMMFKAKEWLLQTKEGRRPWDTEGESIAKGDANDPEIKKVIIKLIAQIQKPINFYHPSYHAILNTLVEGSKVDFDTANKIESHFFTKLVMSPEAKNMTKTFWFDHNLIKAGENRPKGFGKFRPRKVGIIGAGYMGSSIALHCAMQNLSVVLKDISKPVADNGKENALLHLKQLVKNEVIEKSKYDECEKLIFTTSNSSDFESCDLVIEAVFENQMVKSKVIKEAEGFLDEYAMIASNTSSISISKLGKTVEIAKNFVGLHFFTPVDQSKLVEIIVGDQTSDETIAKAFDFVKLIKKTPIIVKDNPGFFAARVQNTYILEGLAMLQEGYLPYLIENMGIMSGMTKGPLTLADELGLPLVWEYEKQAAVHYGSTYVPHPAVTILKKLIEDCKRTGKQKNNGIFTYDEDGNKIAHWDRLFEVCPPMQSMEKEDELIDRLLFVQSIEAAWCMQEKILTSVAEANIGSIFGWNYPQFKGGVLHYIEDYGKEKFIAKSKDLYDKFGPRFKAPKWLTKQV